jgi:hypothetical protein
MEPQSEPGAPLVPLDWNPLIDAVWWTKEMAALRAQLREQFPQAEPELITAAIDVATTRVAIRARVPNFLPVIVGREARAWLRHELDTRHHRLPPIL